MRIYPHNCMFTYTRTHTYTHIHTHTHAHTHTHTHTQNTHTYTHKNTRARMYAYMHKQAYTLRSVTRTCSHKCLHTRPQSKKILLQKRTEKCNAQLNIHDTRSLAHTYELVCFLSHTQHTHTHTHTHTLNALTLRLKKGRTV